MDLKAKFRLTIAVAAAGLLVLSGVWVQSEHSRILAEKQAQAENLVAIPFSVVTQQYQLEKAGKITRAEAQAKAIEILKNVRYGEGNYFWVNDMHPTMLLHPTHPEFDGTDLTNYKDAQGQRLFITAVRIVREHGQGFVRYRWPRPGQEMNRSVPKISFVRGFEPWGWIIGTGIYIDDVEAAWRANAATAALVTAICFMVLLIFSFSVYHSIFPRLSLIVGDMKNIALRSGDFSGATLRAFSPENVSRPDEVSVLMSGFNEMLSAIRKRDEQLRRHEEELEQQVAARTTQLQKAHSELVDAHAEIQLFLECIPSILIGLDSTGHIVRWNQTASKAFGIDDQQAKGRTIADCGIKWLRPDMSKLVSGWLEADTILRCENITYEKDGGTRFLGVSVRPILSKQNDRMGIILTGADTTERKGLEAQLMQAHKLEAVGQLAAGIAHEINTPAQYVADNTTFLKESYPPLIELVNLCATIRLEAAQSIPADLLAKFDQLLKQADLPYIEKEIPKAIDQSLEGLQRISKIVKAMKEFSHPGSSDKVAVDINRAIQTTITVARNEWKYVAELNTDLDNSLPPVPCLQGEFQQVILNLIVNAAQAIALVVGDGSNEKGKITVSTRLKEESVEIAIRDTGPGIPPEIQSRIFEPFFTTKPVGKGTGQGLSLAHATIVKQHQGRIWFESEMGKGTTFYLRLPLQTSLAASATV